jgi:hypothetical protein
MTKIKLAILAAVLLALAACVAPFESSPGSGDQQEPYFSNNGNQDAPTGRTERLMEGQDVQEGR